MKQIPKDAENRVKKYLADGYSYRLVAQKTGVGSSTVGRIAKKEVLDRTVVKTGRPLKLTPRDEAYCVRNITSGGKENAVQVQNALKTELGLSVSAATVRRVLKKGGLGAFVKPKKPLLSKKNVNTMGKNCT